MMKIQARTEESRWSRLKSAKNLSELFPNKLTNWKKFSFKNLKKDQLLILLLAGILLMVIAVPAGKTKEHASSASDGNTGKTVRGTSDGTDEEAYTTYLEDRLSRILSQIEGAGEVKVMITLKSSAEGYRIGSGNGDGRRQPGRNQTVVKGIQKRKYSICK